VRFNGRKENLHSLWDTALVELEAGTAAEVMQPLRLINHACVFTAVH
jgi:hypothetical protein